MIFESTTALSNGLSLQGIKAGEHGKPTVLALHGWQDNCHSFVPLFNVIGQYNCYAFDFPGHGLSDWRHPTAHYYLTEYVDDVLNIINSTIKEPVHLVGHSMGAMVATLFTACFPEKVKSLTLIDGIGFITTPAQDVVKQLQQAFDNRERLSKKPSKVYTSLDLLIAMRIQASDLNEENARLIMKRNCMNVNNGVKLTIDPKLKLASAFRFCDEQAHSICKNISIHTNVILASSNNAGFTDAYVRYAHDFQSISCYELEGGHHCHMEQPQALAAILRQIIALSN